MNQLPSDILFNIFIQLSYEQKKECMLVCQQWEEAIRTRCLFHTLEVSNTQCFYDLLEIMDRNPSLKKQVVNFNLHEWDSPNKKKIADYFPNLQQFSFTRAPTGSRNYAESDLLMSKDRMRSIHDQGRCQLLVSLSKRGSLSHLNELCVDYFYPENVLPVLKNMPVLKKLSLNGSPITPSQLELIHTDIPSLESLYVHMKDLDQPFPTVITPAAFIHRLSVCVDYIDEEEQINWHHYVPEKYPRLEYYNIETESKSVNENDIDTYPHLFSVAIIPLLKKLGPQLKFLNLAGAQFDQFTIFQRLDEYGCQIRNIWIDCKDDDAWQTGLSQSNQANYIEDLDIYLAYQWSYAWLESMKVLKSLRIVFNSDFEIQIDLIKLFKACSKTVKFIDFNNVSYCISDDSCEDTFPIERLHIPSNQLPANIDTFITNCLPNLHNLTLCGLLDTTTLSFPKHHFTYLRLDFYKRTKFSNFSVTTLKNSRHLLFKPRDKNTYVHLLDDNFTKPISADSFNGSPFVDLVCWSVRELIIDDHKALLD